MQRPGYNGFRPTKGMLLPILIYRTIASQFLIDVIFASVRVTLTQTPESVFESQIDYPFKEDQEQCYATFNSFLNFLCLY